MRTFGTSMWQFTPVPLGVARTNIIAGYWANVDTRGTNSGFVTYGTGTVDGRAAFAATWPNVSYYQFSVSEADYKLNAFQIVIISRSAISAGDFDLELNYAQVQWEAGWVDGGEYGLWLGPDGRSSGAGYSGTPGYSYEFPGSGVAGGLLDSDPSTGLIFHRFNSNVPGRYVFQFRGGYPLANP